MNASSTPTAATPSCERVPAPAERPARTEIKHLFWVPQLDFARKYGMAVVSLCGKKTQKPFPKDREGRIPVVGGLVPLLETRDCLLCGRALSAELARRDRARERGQR